MKQKKGTAEGKNPANFDGNGKFTKGNKVGRPKRESGKAFLTQLREALVVVEKERGKTLAQHAVEKAFTDNKVLVAILKKFAPDLAQVKMAQDGAINVTFSVKDFRKDGTADAK